MATVTLDIRTLSFITAGICWLFAAGIAFFGAAQQRQRGIPLVAAAYAMIGAGFFLMAHRDVWSDQVTIVVANGLIIAGMTSLFEGTRRFQGRADAIHPFSLAAMVLGIGLFLHFTYLDPSVRSRVITSASLLCLIGAFTARELLSRGGRQGLWRLPELATGALFLVFALFQLFRVFWTLGEGSIASFMTAGHLHALAILSGILLVSGSAFGYVWMVGKRYEQELVAISRQDPLTGLLNRRGVGELALREFAKMERGTREIASVLVDIDEFKGINDRYGHDAGDRVIIAFANLLKDGLRPFDLLGRLGGDEFILLLPDTKPEEAVGIAERLRAKIAETPLELNGSRERVTASFGVARIVSQPRDLDEVIPAADRAMYRAKQEGRNRVTLL